MDRRVILAFAVAPAVVPLAVIVWALATGEHARESVVLGSIYGAFTYGAAVFLGVPSYRVFSRNRWTRWWQYASLGAAIGLAVLLVLSAMAQRLLFDWRLVLVFVGIGVLSTTVFWLMAIWDGPLGRAPSSGRRAV